MKFVIAEEYQSTKVVFTKFYVPNWSKDMFVIKKVKNIVLWTPLLVILTVIFVRFVERLTKKNCKNQTKKNFKSRKTIKRKGNKIYVT